MIWSDWPLAAFCLLLRSIFSYIWLTLGSLGAFINAKLKAFDIFLSFESVKVKSWVAIDLVAFLELFLEGYLLSLK